MSQREKYKNKYRIKSIRLKYYNYADEGCYFITICAKNRENYFGDVVNGKMKLSNIGELAKNELSRTEKMRFNIKLDEWVIMPNHIHAIIIQKPASASVETRRGALAMNGEKFASVVPFKNKFGPLPKNSLSSIINHYKGAVKNWCNKNMIDFAWQPRFYDHIIRNEKSLINIRKYIRDNPLKWDLDRNNNKNLFM